MSRESLTDARERPSVFELSAHPGWNGCPGHSRHWFTIRGHVGLPSPFCIRCGFTNPRQLTTDDWFLLGELFPDKYGETAALVRDELESGS